MNKPYTILFQKAKDGSAVKDSLDDFGLVAVSYPLAPAKDMKDIVVRDWSDEHGEDAYIPQELRMKAYDFEVQLCYKGGLKTAYQKIKAFRDYLMGLDGQGAELKIYNSHTNTGRRGVYLKKFGDAELFVSEEDIVEFSVIFRITDPKTDVVFRNNKLVEL